MDRSLSPILFSADFGNSEALTPAAFEQTTTREIGFKEDWLQRAIAQNPDLVIAACREAELTDELWIFWAREFPVESAGNIDLLLISESGRIAIVETKLSYNPDGRRSVVAQTLEYAIHFPSVDVARLPPIPEVDGHPFADVDTVHNRIQEGDYLLIITGDRLDSRAVKLGQSLLGRHLVRGWELALVEVAVFRKALDEGTRQGLLVPHLRGAIAIEQRQVVKIKVEGERTRIEVELAAPVAMTTARQQRTEADFFGAFPEGQKNFADALRVLRKRANVNFRFGDSARSALILEFRGANILEFYPDGKVRFRSDRFVQGLGQELASYYQDELHSLFPVASKNWFKEEKLDPKRADVLLKLLVEVIDKANTSL